MFFRCVCKVLPNFLSVWFKQNLLFWCILISYGGGALSENCNVDHLLVKIERLYLTFPKYGQGQVTEISSRSPGPQCGELSENGERIMSCRGFVWKQKTHTHRSSYRVLSGLNLWRFYWSHLNVELPFGRLFNRHTIVFALINLYKC